MSNIDILKRYQSQERQLSKLFFWLDENEMSLQELTKEDLELFFKISKSARGTNGQIKIKLKQVLDGEGIPSLWVQTAIVPYPSLYMSLDYVLKDVNDYARNKGYEKYKVEPDGFDSVKAAIILMWLGFSAQEGGYVLKDDVYKTCILYKKTEYPFTENVADFIERYKKSTGYFAGERPKVKFRVYKDDEYFIRSTRTASRDKIIKRLFERVSDLDIDIKSIQKAGLFDRVYQAEKSGKDAIGILSQDYSEYKEYKKKRIGLE